MLVRYFSFFICLGFPMYLCIFLENIFRTDKENLKKWSYCFNETRFSFKSECPLVAKLSSWTQDICMDGRTPYHYTIGFDFTEVDDMTYSPIITHHGWKYIWIDSEVVNCPCEGSELPVIKKRPASPKEEMKAIAVNRLGISPDLTVASCVSAWSMQSGCTIFLSFTTAGPNLGRKITGSWFGPITLHEPQGSDVLALAFAKWYRKYPWPFPRNWSNTSCEIV